MLTNKALNGNLKSAAFILREAVDEEITIQGYPTKVEVEFVASKNTEG
jgi:hypothetical protein